MFVPDFNKEVNKGRIFYRFAFSDLQQITKAKTVGDRVKVYTDRYGWEFCDAVREFGSNEKIKLEAYNRPIQLERWA
jgi:hypothetical protein